MADRIGVISKGELIVVEDKEVLMRKLGKKNRPIEPSDKSRHAQMVALVEQMLALHQSLAAAQTPPEKTPSNAKSPPPTSRLTGWSMTSTA